MDEQKLYQVALSLIPGVGNLLAKTLISYCGSAEAVFQTSAHKLGKIPGIGPKTLRNILKSNFLKEAERELKLAEEKGAYLLAYTDKAYPSRLKQVADAPNLLYYQGNILPDAPRIVAIVGTRQASPYGKQICEQIITDFKPYQPLIISGLAYGIDVAAHRAALRHALPTVGVMASGLDIIYPSAHKHTAREMLAQGGLLTENPFGTEPDAFKFPARNRIIAGMADVIIVIEAAEKGGALITADIACSYDREVFAVPGPLGSPQSAGCNQLIKFSKAQLFLSVSDLVEIMGWSPGKEDLAKTETFETKFLSEQEKQVVGLLKEYPTGLQIDELSWRSQLSLSQLASVLLNLEFQNIVRSLPGKKFRLQ